MNLNGDTYHTHFLEVWDVGGGVSGTYPSKLSAGVIDNIHYWKENALTEWAFGTTRSHNYGRERQYIGAFKAQIASN